MHVIETPTLLLRAFEESDFDAVHEYASDPEVTRYLSWGPNSEADTRDFICRSREAFWTGGARDLEFAIVERSRERLVGSCGLMPRRIDYREYEIGYVLNPRYRNRGVALEAVTHLLRFAFNVIGAHRVFAYIDPRNEPSVRLAEKAGFRREEHQLCDVKVRGEWRDTFVYARLEDEQ